MADIDLGSVAKISKLRRAFLTGVRVSENIYRYIALTLIVIGWLGEIAIIVARNIVDSEPAWTVDVVTLCLMFGSLLYIGLVKNHIGFVVITRKLSGHAVLGRVQPVVSILIVAALLFESIRAVISTYGFGASAGTPGFYFPLWVVVLVAPIFSFVLLIQLVVKLVRPQVDSETSVD
jgi:TRAP-type C4-dicarboxylate transport system permease small subunit